MEFIIVDGQEVMVDGDVATRLLMEDRKPYIRQNGGVYLYLIDERREVSLGEWIIGHVDGFLVDHIDRIKTNNLRTNLRHVTRCGNAQNAVKSRRGESGFVGVFKRSETSFRVKIVIDGKPTHFGTYKTAREAAEVYDRKVVELGRLNPTNKSLGLL